MHDVAPFNDQTKSDPSLTIHASCCQDARGEGPLDFWDSNTGRWVEVTDDIHLSSIKNMHEFWFRSRGVSILNGGFTKHLSTKSCWTHLLSWKWWILAIGDLGVFPRCLASCRPSVAWISWRLHHRFGLRVLWNWRGDDGDDWTSFGKMEIGVSTCVITIVSATQFFFVNFLGELFRMHRKASSFSGNYLPEL